MKPLKYVFVWMLCLFATTELFGQAIYVPRTVEQVLVKNLTGGTTTAGIALCGSTTPNVLDIATWTGTGTSCIGFSNGVSGQIIVSGRVDFALGGLEPNKDYFLGPGGSITTNVGSATYKQRVIRSIGTNTGYIVNDTAEWGTIYGTPTSNAELEAALAMKADKSITISTTSPLTGGGDLSANRTLGINKATGTQSGYLDPADWVTFNGKQNALGFTPENSANKAVVGGYPSLDANSKVVQNPASGTSTPGADKIVMSDGTGKINDGWLSSNVTQLGSSISLNELSSITAGKLLGRNNSTGGSPEEITIGSGLSLSGATLSATGGGGSGSSLTITGLSGGTTTAGCALYFSASDTLSVATYTGSNTAAIGFSNGNIGEIIVSGRVVGLTGLTPGKWYVLSSNGSISLTGVSTPGYIIQTVLYSTGTSTGIVCIQPPIIN